MSKLEDSMTKVLSAATVVTTILALSSPVQAIECSDPPRSVLGQCKKLHGGWCDNQTGLWRALNTQTQAVKQCVKARARARWADGDSGI